MEWIFPTLGLTATIIFGGLSVYLIVTRRYPGHISFIREDTIPLFDAIVKNFPELSVLYKDRPVNEGLVLLKGAFVNTGSKDIAADMIAEDLALQLPDKFRWHSARIISHSPSQHGMVKVGKSRIIMKTELLRCKEFIRFEAVAEVPVATDGKSESGTDIKKKLSEALRVTHRIADTAKVKIRDWPDEDGARRRLKAIRVPMGLLVVLILFTIGTSFLTHPSRFVFSFPHDGRTTDVSAIAKPKGMVLLKGVNETKFNRSLPAQEFFVTPGLVASTRSDRFSKVVNAIATFAALLAVSVFSVLLSRELWQAKRFKKLLAIGEDETNTSEPTRPPPPASAPSVSAEKVT